MILDPKKYLNHLDDRHLKDIVGLYEGYIGSFDYLSRNNLLANDIYEFELPAVLDINQYRQTNKRRFDKLYNKKGIKFRVHRAGLDDKDTITAYYVKYLKKYDMLEDEGFAKANVLYWLTNGCIYYIRSADDDIQAFVAITSFKDNNKGEEVYALRIQPFFYYNNRKNKMFFETLTRKIVFTVQHENDLPYLHVQTAILEPDEIDVGTSYMKQNVYYHGDPRFKKYYSILGNDDFSDKMDSTGNWLTSDEEAKEYERKISDFFEKIEINKEKLIKMVGEPIFPPICDESDKMVMKEYEERSAV